MGIALSLMRNMRNVKLQLWGSEMHTQHIKRTWNDVPLSMAKRTTPIFCLNNFSFDIVKLFLRVGGLRWFWLPSLWVIIKSKVMLFFRRQVVVFIADFGCRSVCLYKILKIEKLRFCDYIVSSPTEVKPSYAPKYLN